MHTILTVLNHVLAGPSTGSSGSSSKGNSFTPLLLLGGLFFVAYFVFLRPARNRQRAALEERRGVEVGDEVTTTAGLLATVVAVDDDYLTLEVAPGVNCRYVPAAILRVNRDEEEDEGTSDDAHEHDHDHDDHDVTNHEVIDSPDGDSTDTDTTDPTGGTTPS